MSIEQLDKEIWKLRERVSSTTSHLKEAADLLKRKCDRLGAFAECTMRADTLQALVSGDPLAHLTNATQTRDAEVIVSLLAKIQTDMEEIGSASAILRRLKMPL